MSQTRCKLMVKVQSDNIDQAVRTFDLPLHAGQAINFSVVHRDFLGRQFGMIEIDMGQYDDTTAVQEQYLEHNPAVAWYEVEEI